MVNEKEGFSFLRQIMEYNSTRDYDEEKMCKFIYVSFPHFAWDYRFYRRRRRRRCEPRLTNVNPQSFALRNKWTRGPNRVKTRKKMFT